MTVKKHQILNTVSISMFFCHLNSYIYIFFCCNENLHFFLLLIFEIVALQTRVGPEFGVKWILNILKKY